MNNFITEICKYISAFICLLYKHVRVCTTTTNTTTTATTVATSIFD